MAGQYSMPINVSDALRQPLGEEELRSLTYDPKPEEH